MVLVLWAWLAVALCSVKAKTTLVFCTIPPGFILVVPRNGQYVYIYIYIYTVLVLWAWLAVVVC
jgi:hypothetical protein